MAEADLNSEPRLARVEAIHVRVPFRRPLLDATGEFTHRRSWLLRVIGEDGAEGLGEAALNPFAEEVTTASLATLIREIVPALAAERMPVWSELAAEGEPGRAAMAGVGVSSGRSSPSSPFALELLARIEHRLVLGARTDHMDRLRRSPRACAARTMFSQRILSCA